jgi:type I restriction enzyme S subunit
MSLFRPHDEADFCKHLFTTERFKKLVSQNLGATINSINTSDMKSFTFLLPPRAAWRQIGKILSAQDRIIELQREQRSLLIEQRAALLQQLMTGQRRVEVSSSRTERRSA